MKKIALFGGTFNPIHNGHLLAAETVAEQLDLDEVVFIPCSQPPHKRSAALASEQDRLQMIKLAIKGNADFNVSDFEIKQGGKSYSIETARYFKKKLPDVKLYFIIGGDSLAQLPSWRQIEELSRLVRFVAVNRPGAQKAIHDIKHRTVIMPAVDIASRDIVRRFKSNKSARYLLPDKVIEYIKEKGIY